MWIEKETNAKGKTQYRFREYYYDKLTGKKKSVSTTFARDTKKIRERAVLELEEKIKEAQRDTAAEMTLGELAEEWLQDYKHTVKENTYMDRVSNVKMIPKRLKNTPLERLDFSMINKYLRSLKRQGYAKNSVKNYFSTFRVMFAYGLEYGDLLDYELYSRLKKPDYKYVDDDDFKYLEQEELDSVVNQLREFGHDEMARLALLQTYTGTRISELTCIDYEKNINWTDNTILIDRSYIPKTKGFDTPKNGKTRTISFNETTKLLLQEQIKHTQLKTLAHGLNKKPYLFKKEDGHPLDYSVANYYFRKIRVGDKTISSHIFRHTFIARMMEQGVELHLIAQHVGNSSRTIERYYSHFTETMKKQLVDEIAMIDFGD